MYRTVDNSGVDPMAAGNRGNHGVHNRRITALAAVRRRLRQR